jgi:hypothetical protein
MGHGQLCAGIRKALDSISELAVPQERRIHVKQVCALSSLVCFLCSASVAIRNLFLLFKVQIVCSRQGFHEPKKHEDPSKQRPNSTSVRIGCQFKVNMSKQKMGSEWRITMVKRGHNHQMDKLPQYHRLDDKVLREIERLVDLNQSTKAIHSRLEVDFQALFDKEQVKHVVKKLEAEKPKVDDVTQPLTMLGDYSSKEIHYTNDVRSLFAAESAIPPPRRVEQQKRRRYANVVEMAKDLAEPVSRDESTQNRVIRTLSDVTASAKRRRPADSSDESDEPDTSSHYNQDHSGGDSDDCNGGDGDGGSDLSNECEPVPRDPDVIPTKGWPRTNRLKNRIEISRRPVSNATPKKRREG